MVTTTGTVSLACLVLSARLPSWQFCIQPAADAALLPAYLQSVNADVYAGLRRLFVERMDVDPDFDFHG